MKLTNRDWATLWNAKRIHDSGEYDGISPFGAGQARHFQKLERLGLISYDGPGENEHSRPCQIYKLTLKADELLKARSAA